MMNDRNQRRCKSCGSDLLEPLLKRTNVPVHQNLLCGSREQARAMRTGTLALARCASCSFVFNAEFEIGLVEYGRRYDAGLGFSDVALRYIDDQIAEFIPFVAGRAIVELGCGSGDFLVRLVERAGGATRGFGVDPSYRGAETQLEGRVNFRTERLREGVDEGCFDVALCRQVMQHVEHPTEFFRAVHKLLRPTVDSAIFVEVPNFRWTLQQRVYWDVFYEQCSFYCHESLGNALALAGFRVLQMRAVHESQYLWAQAQPNYITHAGGAQLRDDLPGLTEVFRAGELRALRRLQALVTDRFADGIAIWGAGAKGATLAHLVDPHTIFVRCVVDVNPAKIGGFLPLTGHPIVAPGELATRDIRVILLANSIYRCEISALLLRLGISERIEILSAFDEDA